MDSGAAVGVRRPYPSLRLPPPDTTPLPVDVGRSETSGVKGRDGGVPLVTWSWSTSGRCVHEGQWALSMTFVHCTQGTYVGVLVCLVRLPVSFGSEFRVEPVKGIHTGTCLVKSGGPESKGLPFYLFYHGGNTSTLLYSTHFIDRVTDRVHSSTSVSCLLSMCR